MANCKDCLHVEVCNSRFPDPNNERLICENFKDRSRFVELPCKACDTCFIFFSREEAEQALKERENNANNKNDT